MLAGSGPRDSTSGRRGLSFLGLLIALPVLIALTAWAALSDLRPALGLVPDPLRRVLPGRFVLRERRVQGIGDGPPCPQVALLLRRRSLPAAPPSIGVRSSLPRRRSHTATTGWPGRLASSWSVAWRTCSAAIRVRRRVFREPPASPRPWPSPSSPYHGTRAWAVRRLGREQCDAEPRRGADRLVCTRRRIRLRCSRHLASRRLSRRAGKRAAHRHVCRPCAGCCPVCSGWWLWRRDLAVPAAVALSYVIYERASVDISPDFTAKTLAVAAPIVMLMTTRALLFDLPDPRPWLRSHRPSACSRAPRRGRRLRRPSGWSSGLALRGATGRPRPPRRGADEFRPLVEGKPTLFLGKDFYAPWRLCVARTVDLIEYQLPSRFRSLFAARSPSGL